MKATRPPGPGLYALLAVLALVAAACSGATTDTTEDGGTTATTEAGGEAPVTTAAGGGGPALDATFRVGLIANITTANWWASLDTQSQAQNQAFLTNMKTSLFTSSLPGFVHVPGIAATDTPVEPFQEGDVWVVEQPIQDDWTWSDGEPVTAHDLVFYWDVVDEFKLGSNHAAAFPSQVTDVSAPDDYTVRVEFDGRPGLAAWNNGVGFAKFVPGHFWQEHVDAARAAADELTEGITDEEATQAIVDGSLANDTPEDDLTPEDVTTEDITVYIEDAGAAEALTVLYSVEAPMEPSVGAIQFDQWETGAFAATVANATYRDRGTENTLYSDGSFRIANAGRGEDAVYGGAGSGDVISSYVEGPFVSEILWIEHDKKDTAYEKLVGGELDYVYDPTGLTLGVRNTLAGNPDLRFSVNQTEGFRYLAFNMRKAPMSDKAFRTAVATVVNKELIADTVLAGSVFPGYTIVHPDLAYWHNPNVNRPGWYDGAPGSEIQRFTEAVEILKDEGYTWDVEPVVDPNSAQDPVQVAGQGLTMPNGTKVPELTILAPGAGYDPFRATFSLWITAFMNDLGIPVVTQQSDFNAIIGAVFPPKTPEEAQQWDMYMLGWGRGDITLPGTNLVSFFHSNQDAVTAGGFNTPGFKNADFDAAADAFEMATTAEEAQKWTFEMERILQEELPYVVLFRTPIIEAFRSGVQFPTETIMGGHQGFPNAWPNAVRVSE